MRVDSISTRIIQQLIVNFTKGSKAKGYKPLSPKSVKNSVSFISSVMEYAMRLEIVEKNPCRNALLPPLTDSKEKDIYTVEEAQLFINTLMDKAPLHYQVFFILAIYGGLRLGEICGLEWDAVNFEDNIIHICKSASFIQHEGIVVHTPKTRSSNRYLKLPTLVFDYLRKLKKHYEDESERLGTKWIDTDNAVIKTEFGSRINPLTPPKWLRRFCEANGLRFVSVHSFRHLNASLLIGAGSDVRTVSACLGHSTPTTTLGIYAHAFLENQAKASVAVANNFALKIPS